MEKKNKDNLLLALWVVFLIVTAPVWILLECVKQM